MTRGPSRVSPFLIPMLIIDMSSGLISMRLRATGPNHSVVSACTTGAHAIGDAAEIIRRGDADVMVAGGSEASIVPVGIVGFDEHEGIDDVVTASRPAPAAPSMPTATASCAAKGRQCSSSNLPITRWRAGRTSSPNSSAMGARQTPTTWSTPRRRARGWRGRCD